MKIGRARGNYRGLPARRSYELRIKETEEPAAVTVGDRPLDEVSAETARGWTYDASDRTVAVRTGRLPTAKPTRIVLEGS